jgi:hypothetical protein
VSDGSVDDYSEIPRLVSERLTSLESENARLLNELAASRLATENYAALWADSPDLSEATTLRRELAGYREVVEQAKAFKRNPSITRTMALVEAVDRLPPTPTGDTNASNEA